MLDDADIEAAQPRARPYKLTAGRGVFVLVTPAGGKLWRYKFRVHGRETSMSLGTFPAVNVTDAMAARDRVRAQVRAGMNPSGVRKAERAAALEAADTTFSVALSSAGELSITLHGYRVRLSRHQTDAIRSTLLANEGEAPC